MNPQICFLPCVSLQSIPTLVPCVLLARALLSGKMQVMAFGTKRCPGKQLLKMDSDDITGQMTNEKLSAVAPQQSLTLSMTENCDGEQVQNGASVRLGWPGLRQQPLCRCWSSPRLRTAASNKQSYLLPLLQPEQSNRASGRDFVRSHQCLKSDSVAKKCCQVLV